MSVGEVLDALASPDNAVRRAVELLQAGEVVALPTETVYGLAGDAGNVQAVAKIFAAKNRPHFDPLIVHVKDRAQAEQVAILEDDVAERLLEAFWPGPLTVLLPKRDSIPELVTSGSLLVAVRSPSHPVFRAVLEALNRPLAAPSANPFGRISPTTAEHVRQGLGDKIALILDGGPCRHGLESTIVYPLNGELHLLRKGPVTQEELEAFGPVKVTSAAGKKAAPGQLTSHYAPGKPLFLVDGPGRVRDRRQAGYLAWKEKPAGFAASEVLSASGDTVEAAANLFAALHRLDAAPVERIYAEKIPGTGLGAAIQDRLTRAAAGR